MFKSILRKKKRLNSDNYCIYHKLNFCLGKILTEIFVDILLILHQASSVQGKIVQYKISDNILIMSKPSDPLAGVKCFTIGGRMTDTRQRCLGMTDEERRWRAQWLKDQILSTEEPKDVPEFYKDTTHFVRRLWKTPLYRFQKLLEPAMGQSGAFLTRHFVGKSVVLLMITYGLTYFFKYHSNNFEFRRSFETFHAGVPMFPDHPDYPNLPVKKPSDYYDQGFYSSVLCQEAHPREVVRYLKPPPPPPIVYEEEKQMQELLEEVVCEPPKPETAEN